MVQDRAHQLAERAAEREQREREEREREQREREEQEQEAARTADEGDGRSAGDQGGRRSS